MDEILSLIMSRWLQQSVLLGPVNVKLLWAPLTSQPCTGEIPSAKGNTYMSFFPNLTAILAAKNVTHSKTKRRSSSDHGNDDLKINLAETCINPTKIATAISEAINFSSGFPTIVVMITKTKSNYYNTK